MLELIESCDKHTLDGYISIWSVSKFYSELEDRNFKKKIEYNRIKLYIE